MIITHKRKKSLLDLKKVKTIYIPIIESNQRMYNLDNINSENLIKKSIPSSEKNCENLKTIKIISPQSNKFPITKYNNNTYNYCLLS